MNGALFSAAALRAVAVCCEHPKLQLKFSTAHAAKGIEADAVVVLVLSTGRYGFPSGVTGDPLLSLVLADADPLAHAEERRPFYVAFTRAKCWVRRTEARQGTAFRALSSAMTRARSLLSSGRWSRTSGSASNGSSPWSRRGRSCVSGSRLPGHGTAATPCRARPSPVASCHDRRHGRWSPTQLRGGAPAWSRLNPGRQLRRIG